MDLFVMFIVWLAILQASVLATTVYLHRTLTHRGMEVHPALALFFHIELILFTGISPREWVAVHRKHHQFSDKEGDPHSPYLLGMWNVFFTNALLYRKVAKDVATVRKYTPDYKSTLVDRIPEQGYLIVLGLLIFMAMFGWLAGAVAFVLHAVFYIFLNASINSICHMRGYRNFENKATNVQWIALLTGGEGLHNNHHEYPTAAHFAMKGGEFDPAWPFIRLFESFGLARVKRLPVAKAA